ncbi:hypothetical protein TNIN_409701 [Trichonephila inaurata madagascariensis]|uniref:Uncharacterized protein n=1 Tax=Trichonephila inaurata madagascariensis TaxID=2747483 RepID=A0A8X6K1B9_9ARAC|nr:hypothetical protein TNIN_409701 [Trichonephila inaurata madagascariensis]
MSETSRQTEAVNQIPPIQANTSQLNFNCNPNVNLSIPNGNNNDIKSLLGVTVQYLIQLLNAMNTTPTLGNNFDQVNSAQVDANQMYSLIEASCNKNKNQ